MPKVKIIILDEKGDMLSQFWLMPTDKQMDHLKRPVLLSNAIEDELARRFEFEEVDE